jgi:DNA-binding beta-propeller fold protein YncE
MRRIAALHVRLGLAVLLIAAGGLVPQAASVSTGGGAPPGWLLVASIGESKVDIVDEATWQVIASLRTGPDPHEVRVSPDGRRAYVVAGRAITVVDVQARRVHATLALGEFSAHDVRVSRDGRRLWAACAGTQTVLELDAESGAVLRRYPTARDGAWFVEVAPDESRLYTPNMEGKSVSVITRDSGTVAVTPFDEAAYGIDVTPDGRHLWVSGRHLAVIDTRTPTAVRTITTPEPETGRLRITPDGARVVVAMERSVLVLDATSGRVLRRIALEATPKVLTLSDDGSRAYVTNPDANTATAVDLTEGRVIRTFDTGRRPDGVAWAPKR